MGRQHVNSSRVKKLGNPIDREMTTPLFLLRCCQMGLSLSDLDKLTVGTVFDMVTEQANDDYDYPELATQEDFDSF